MNNRVLLALDNGFGDIKICLDYKYNKKVASIALVDKDTVVTDENALQFGDSQYYVFEDAAKLPASSQLPITNFEELKFATPIFIAALEKEYRTKITDLSLGLSLAMVNRGKEFKTYVSDKTSIDESNIVLLPQGIGSKIAYTEYGLDINNPTKKNDHKSENYLGVDIGFNTLDIFQVINGKISSNATRGIESKGVIQVAMRLREVVKDRIGLDLDVPAIKLILIKGTHTVRGNTTDFSADVDRLVVDYILETLQTIESKFSSSIDKMDNILLVGGGAALVDSRLKSPKVKEYIDSKYGSTFILIPKSPEYYNVLGYYLRLIELCN